MYYRTVIPLAGREAESLTVDLADYALEGLEEGEDALTAYFSSLPDAEAAAAAFGGSPPEPMPDENWSADWQAAWQPFTIGERFFLCPSWLESETPPGRVRLEMVPGNVFGGGDHPTTQLCLELLEELIEPGARIADIGAGTGILTRAARALGARAVACDIDPASAPMVDVLGSADALATEAFDGLIANIHLGVLRQLRDELHRIARPGAWLLISGFLPEQRGEAAALFGPSEQIRERDGWCAAVFRAAH